MLFVFIGILIFVGIAGGIVYFIYNFFRYRLIQSGKLSLKLDSRINKFYVIALVVLSAILTYTAFFPTNSFYFNEFKSATSRTVPSSAEIIKKKSSYPDVHGKYQSSSLIKISKEDYIKLFNDLFKDTQFKKNGETFNAEEFNQVLSEEKRKQINYFTRRPNSGKQNPFSYIGFLNDSSTIVIDKYSD